MLAAKIDAPNSHGRKELTSQSHTLTLKQVPLYFCSHTHISTCSHRNIHTYITHIYQIYTIYVHTYIIHICIYDTTLHKHMHLIYIHANTFVHHVLSGISISTLIFIKGCDALFLIFKYLCTHCIH